MDEQPIKKVTLPPDEEGAAAAGPGPAAAGPGGLQKNRKGSRMHVVPMPKTNFGVPSKASLRVVKLEKTREGSLISKLHDFFDDPLVENFLHLLLIIDVLIVFAELFLMMEYPKCEIITRDCDACCPVGYGDGDGDIDLGRFLGGGGSSKFTGECAAGYEMTGKTTCDANKWETANHIKETLFWVTVTILS